MKLLSAILSVLLAIPLAAAADESGERYERLVDEVLEMTGALEIGTQMSDFIVAQMFSAMKATNSDLPERAYDALADEVKLTVNEAMESGSFNELMYPIYRRYLSEADLEAMVAFYRTPQGRRIVEVMPLMTQEAMAAGQAWGASLGPQIRERVRQRLEDEGFELQ